MMGSVLILLGAVLMIAAVAVLGGLVSGNRGRWARGVLDRAGASKNDRQFLSLYFVVLVVAPLLGGAVLIAVGLRQLI